MQVLAKETSKQESKVDQNSNASPAPKRAIRHFLSANWHKCNARPEGSWIEINLTFFDFLEIRMHPSSYSNHLANFLNIPASINRGCLSKFNTLFHALWLPSFWLFSSFIFPLPSKTFWRL